MFFDLENNVISQLEKKVGTLISIWHGKIKESNPNYVKILNKTAAVYVQTNLDIARLQFSYEKKVFRASVSNFDLNNFTRKYFFYDRNSFLGGEKIRVIGVRYICRDLLVFANHSILDWTF